MKNKSWAKGAAVLILLLCAIVPRLQLVGKIPAVQPQWALRAQWFWEALSEGRIQDTYIAPHPGLTVMWYAGAAQQFTSDETRHGRVVAASRANAVMGTLLILLAAWLARRILVLDGVERAGSLALFFGLVLALDPFLILMTGLIGLDGPVSLMILVAFLVLVLHLRQGSRATLLAAEGVRVETAVSPMPTTDPSHLTMFTSLYPRTHGSLRNGAPLRDPSLPNLVEWLRDLGYETGAFVSRKHLIPASLRLSGFDFEDGPNGPERRGGDTIENALQWARDRQGEQFFVWLHLFDPHFPYDPPEPFQSRFESPDSDWPIPQDHRFPNPFPVEYRETLIQRYDAEIAYTDSLVERFVEELRVMIPNGDPPLSFW